MGDASMRSTFVVGRGLRAHAVRRTGFVFDSRFAPPSAPLTDAALQLVAEGTVEILGPEPAIWEAPVAWIALESSLEGPPRERRTTFRTHGAPFAAVDLRIAVELVRGGVSHVPRRIALDPATIAALARCVPSETEAPDISASPFAELLAKLARDGVIAEGIGAEPLPLERVWRGVLPLAERFAALPTLQEVSSASGRSVRQVSREISALTRAAGMAEGWRETMRRFRIKLAILALSIPDPSIGEVAHAVGYGSVDAMARAFRDAGLPAPNVVRAEVGAARVAG